MRRWLLPGAGLLVAAGLVFAVAAVFDNQPPELWVELDSRVPAGDTFELFVSANEPVTYELTYGELETQHVAQDLAVSLIGIPGVQELQIRAVDGSGNETTSQHTIEGIPAIAPVLNGPSTAQAGDPVTFTIEWEDTGLQIVDGSLALVNESGAHAPASIVTGDTELLILAAIPLDVADGTWSVQGQLTDEFGRPFDLLAQLQVSRWAEPVEDLNIAPSTLAVVTDDNREFERQMLERAYSESVPEQLWARPFLLPIEGRSTSGFGAPRRYAPGGPVSFHQGSDIGMPTGTPVFATNEGRVLLADFYPIKGGFVFIDHGMGVSSHYFHLSEVSVEEGEYVDIGDVIGLVGSTGLSTGPHLHWEMRVNGEATNPMAWVDRVLP